MTISDHINKLDNKIKEQYEKEISIFESIFQNAMEAIMVTDMDNRIMWVNRAFEKLYQYESSDIIGESPQLLQSDYHEQDYHLNIWEVIDKKGKWQGELWNRCKDGSIIPVHQSIIKIDSIDHIPAYIVATSFDISEKKDNELKVFQLAYLDAITGLKNKYFIQDKLKNHFCSGIIIIKLKNLRRIDNQYGEGVANQVSKNVIKRLRYAKFHQDIYHYSSNRVVLVLKDELIHESIDHYIDRIKKALSQVFTAENHIITLDFTLGYIVQNKAETWTLHEMIRKAQIAIAYGEDIEFNNIIQYTPAIEEAILEGEQMIQDLRKAVQEEDLEVYFQPFVNLIDGRLYGAEALARWNHPSKGFISPEVFIDIAEKNNLIYDLGKFILVKACTLYKPWLELEPNTLLSINVSVLQLANKHFLNTVKEVLEETEFPASKLVFEITESIAIDNLNIVTHAMNQLHELGIQFALDDFGMGFSSLSKLKNIPVSIVKIDRSFVMDINENLQNSLLVSAMIAMAHHLGMIVVVEGIEESSQIRYLKNNHCKIVQGYYFSKPVPAQEFQTYLGKAFEQYDIDKGIVEEDIRHTIELEKERFKHLHEMTPMGYLSLNMDGTIINSNIILSTISGCSKRDMIGKTYRDLFIDEKFSSTFEMISDWVDKRKVYDFETLLKCHNGSLKNVSLSCFLEYDDQDEPKQINCLVEDITENIENEKKLIRKRAAYRKIFAESPLAFVLWNSEFSIIDWNQHAERIFGWNYTDILGLKMDILIQDDSFHQWKENADHILSGIPMQMTIHNRTKFNRLAICQWFNELIYDEKGNVDYVISIVKDITSDIKVEEEILKMKELMTTQERLAEIGQLSAGIAHEINNPLSYLISNAIMLKEDVEKYTSQMGIFRAFAEDNQFFDDDNAMSKVRSDLQYLEEDFDEIIGSFDEGLAKMKEIVTSLKSYSWSGQAEEFQLYDANAGIKKVLVIAANQLKYSSKVDVDLDENLPQIEALGSQINQVLLNLVINANHAIESLNDDQMGTIGIKTSYSDSSIIISIKDSGPGISQDLEERIFDPFFTTKPEGIGTGLGLSISKEIISDKHNGDLYVRSTKGQGATFIIELPIRQPHQNNASDHL